MTGEISIEHVTVFLSKYISKGAVDLKCSPDVDNNPSYPHIQISSEIKLCIIFFPVSYHFITSFLNVFVLFSLYVWIAWVVTDIW